jgi:molybdenum cofactor biosynthesis enzyme
LTDEEKGPEIAAGEAAAALAEKKRSRVVPLACDAVVDGPHFPVR